MHETLLSLGSSDKGDKPYLIGLFGQGGSSTYAASEYSWCVSRRASQLLDGKPDGVGWTVVKYIYPKNRRDDFFAYLAASPTGEVRTLPPEAGEAIRFKNGSRFAHLGYNFAGGGSAVTKGLYQTLNHILFNPVLPFDLDVGGTLATIYGNGYRLSNATVKEKTRLDKYFEQQQLDAHSALIKTLMQAVLFDKLFEPDLNTELGKIGIRVVVFAKKQGMLPPWMMMYRWIYSRVKILLRVIQK